MSEAHPSAARVSSDGARRRTAPPAATGSRQQAADARGLHGHSFTDNMWAVAVAEMVGTFMLVLTIAATAIGATLADPVAGAPYGSLAVPLAGGIVLAIVVASLGHVSGAHLNPAVTLGLAVNRKFPWRFVPAYVVAQFVGAVGAALVVWGFYGDQARTVAHLAATYPAAGVSAGTAFAVEAVVTFMLVLVVISVATDSRAQSGAAAMAIGAALAAAILISGPLTGAGVNPARSIGPMIVAGKFTDWWVYLLAPILGGIVAATVYDRFLRSGKQPT
ncbi:MAG: Aquaporin [Marmoricola sp.]|nr:Aquaporin [Marmoricola sp.]